MQSHSRAGCGGDRRCLTAAPASALGICVEGAYPPFSEVAADGSIVGFDIDIAKALCGEIGETCELVQVNWDADDPGADRRAAATPSSPRCRTPPSGAG